MPNIERRNTPPQTYEQAEKAAITEYNRSYLNLKGTLSNISGHIFNGINILGITDAEKRTFDKDMYNGMRSGLMLLINTRALNAKVTDNKILKFVGFPGQAIDDAAQNFGRNVNNQMTSATRWQAGFDFISLGVETPSMLAVRNGFNIPSAELVKYVQAEIAFHEAQKKLLTLQHTTTDGVNAIQSPNLKKSLAELDGALATLKRIQPILNNDAQRERMKNLNKFSMKEAEEHKAENPEQFLEEELKNT